MKVIKIKGDWSQELQHYKDNFGRDYLEKTLSALGDQDKWQRLNTHNLVHAKKKIARNSRGFVDPDTMPVLESLRQKIGMTDCQMVILRYLKGETNLYHRDYIPRYDHLERPGLPMAKIDEFENTQYTRMLLMLEDRMPGQFMQIGDDMINNWQAGDLYVYDGKVEYHSAGCCGEQPRLVLRITGIPTPQYQDFINRSEHVL